MFQQEQIEAIKRTLKDVLDSTTQDSVQEIELNLTSRAILHLNSDVCFDLLFNHFNVIQMMHPIFKLLLDKTFLSQATGEV